MEWFDDFHTAGDEECIACAAKPVRCEVCGKGFIHFQFDETDLEAVEGRCDHCQSARVPELMEVG